VAPLDLPPESGAEARLGRELDPVLGREGARELRAGDEAALDDRLAETPARLLLLGERSLELLAREETLLHEDAPERTPGDRGRFHRRCIGSIAVRVKGFVCAGYDRAMRVEIHYCPV